MSQTPYQRRQGDFELRILRDGRLVLIAPDETLLEIAQTLADKAAAQEQHRENQHGEAADPGRQ
jgi:hypothetical protein